MLRSQAGRRCQRAWLLLHFLVAAAVAFPLLLHLQSRLSGDGRQLRIDEWSLKMLDPSCETGTDWTGSAEPGFTCGQGCPAAGPGTPGCFSPVPRKNTVRELLQLKRQKNNYFLVENTDNNNNSSSSSSSSSLELLPDWTGLVAMAASCETAPAAPMSLFQWQIQQEERRVAGTSAQLLSGQDADGDTLLHIAVAQGRRALAFVLAPKMAERGVLDVKEHNGQTALQIAVATNHHLIVRDLLTHGADANTRDHWGRSPLHLCAQKGHVLSLQAIWKTLQWTQQQMDMELHNFEGFTALHVASMSHNAVLKELRHLKKPSASRDAELVQRRRTCAAAVKILLLMGASVGTQDLKSGRTCLHLAAEEANVELLLLLLDCSSSAAAINAAAFNGNTALHVLAALQDCRSQATAAKLLLTRGAEPGIRNLENELPWQLAPEGPPGEKVRQLLKGIRFQR